MSKIKIAFLVSAVVFILLQLIYYSQMPENVAIHFNANGEANGWMPKRANLISSFFIIGIITSAFIGISYILNIIPKSLINVPKKDYWLSSQNKDLLINILKGNLYFIGFATNLLMIIMFHQIYRFNLHTIDKVSIIVIVPYLICVVGSTIYLFVRLNKCPK